MHELINSSCCRQPPREREMHGRILRLQFFMGRPRICQHRCSVGDSREFVSKHAVRGHSRVRQEGATASCLTSSNLLLNISLPDISGPSRIWWARATLCSSQTGNRPAARAMAVSVPATRSVLLSSLDCKLNFLLLRPRRRGAVGEESGR